MDLSAKERQHILDILSNGTWPAAEVALGHGIWWNNDLQVSKLQQAMLAVLYVTVPLSYPEISRIIHDVRYLANALERPALVFEKPDDPDMRRACHRLRHQIYAISLAVHGQVGRYVYETIGLGRRSLITDDFTGLFAPSVRVRYDGESETQVPVNSVLPETYNGYSIQAIGLREYLLLGGVIGSGTYLEEEVWCLTKPSTINMTLGCQVEGERVKLPPQLLSWNSVNAMYPYLGVSVAGDTGIVAYAATKRSDDMDHQNLAFFKPGEGIYYSKSDLKAAVPSVYFGGRVDCGVVDKGYDTSQFDAAVVSTAGVFNVVREVALMWQMVYQLELSIGSGACIARRQCEPNLAAPIMIPLSAISKEVLPNLFCEETLCVAMKLKRAKEDNYYFDFSSWPFLFLSPHCLQIMLVAAVLDKDGMGGIHSDDEADTCAVIRRSMTDKADICGKAKALVDCLSTLYTSIHQKISEDSRKGNDITVEYYGDTAMWAVLNALAPLELVYFGKGHAFLQNSVIISNAVQKSSSCTAFIENLKRDIDNRTLDLGIMKFLAHAAVALDVVKSHILHLVRDGNSSLLALHTVNSTVDESQVNIRWVNRDRIGSLGNLVSSVERSTAASNYVYKAILKSGLVGTWQDCIGKKIVATVDMGLWNIETLTLLYDDAIRVVQLGDVVEISGIGQKTVEVKREFFVKWSEKQSLVKAFLEEMEEMKGIPGPTNGIWEVVLQWQKDMEHNGVEKSILKELLANAIVLSAVATGRLMETPVLTSQISLVRKYMSGKTFLLWNGNAHREVKDIPDSINIPIDLVNSVAHPGLRMANSDFAKQLIKSEHGTVVGRVIDINKSASNSHLQSPPVLAHMYNYILTSSRFRQYSAHDTSLIMASFLTAASDELPNYRMNDERLGLLVDDVKTYETQNSLVVVSHVDEHGNLKVRITGKTTSTNTKGAQGNLSVGAPSVAGASGSFLEQHEEQMETNVDHEMIISSFSALRNALRNRAKSKETKHGLGAVASAIIVQHIAVDRALRYESGNNGCWGIVTRSQTKSVGRKEQTRNKGQIIEIDGPLTAKRGTAFQLAHDKDTNACLLKIMIDRGEFIVFRGLFLIENGDDADVVRMRTGANSDAWIESYPSGQHTGERCGFLPFTIEIG